MITKQFTPKRTVCKVTLSIPGEWASEEVAVAGEFNDWDTSAVKMEQKNGKWETTLRLKPENEYSFKYYIDGQKWENDDAADRYIPNEFGTENSVVSVGK